VKRQKLSVRDHLEDWA